MALGLSQQEEKEGQLSGVEDGNEDIFQPGVQRPQLLTLGSTGSRTSLWAASFFLPSPGPPQASAPSASELGKTSRWSSEAPGSATGLTLTMEPGGLGSNPHSANQQNDLGQVTVPPRAVASSTGKGKHCTR